MLRSKVCNDSFTAEACSNFFPRTCCAKHTNHYKREPELFKEEFRCKQRLCSCSKANCCYDSMSIWCIFSSKSINERTFEENVDGPMAKYGKEFEETEKVFSTNRCFFTEKHCVATYKQIKKGLSYFYPKRIVESDGIPTLQLKV